MLFPTIDFAIFFAVAFVASWLLNPYPTFWKLAIIALSYFFYSWWDWRFVLLLVASTVTSHLGALGASRRVSSPRSAKAALVLSLTGLLGLLGYFKYYGFFAVNVDNMLHGFGAGRLVPLVEPTLPVAISFFTLDRKSTRLHSSHLGI